VKLHVLFVLEILRVVHLRNLNLNELRKSQFNEDVAQTVFEPLLGKWLISCHCVHKVPHGVEIQAKCNKMSLLLIHVHFEREESMAVVVYG